MLHMSVLLLFSFSELMVFDTCVCTCNYNKTHCILSMVTVLHLTSAWPHLKCDVGLEEGNI